MPLAPLPAWAVDKVVDPPFLVVPAAHRNPPNSRRADLRRYLVAGPKTRRRDPNEPLRVYAKLTPGVVAHNDERSAMRISSGPSPRSPACSSARANRPSAGWRAGRRSTARPAPWGRSPPAWAAPSTTCSARRRPSTPSAASPRDHAVGAARLEDSADDPDRKNHRAVLGSWWPNWGQRQASVVREGNGLGQRALLPR